MTEKPVRLARVAAGSYEGRHAGHGWSVFHAHTEYGDKQWIIDRDDFPAFAQSDTLKGARATIAGYGRKIAQKALDESSKLSHASHASSTPRSPKLSSLDGPFTGGGSSRHHATMKTTSTPHQARPPKDLHPAYDWTAAAGELDELRSLKGKALATYCRESAENARSNGYHDVTEGDLRDLHDWLRGARHHASTKRHHATKKPPAQLERLFVGVFPGGISYADRSRERHGDYLKLAFLPYSTLKLEWHVPEAEVPSALRKAIVADATKMRARGGQEYQISAVGQTVQLGGKKSPAQLQREIDETLAGKSKGK
jgi:hypothetical protein